MKKIFVALLVLSSAMVWAGPSNDIKVSSTSMIAQQEKGFDSGILSDGRFDKKYTGRFSFPFSWSNLPAGTKAICVVFDDPDARLIMKAYGVSGETWIHWLVADIDPSLGGLPENASPRDGTLIPGKNTANSTSYQGPAPPADMPKDAARPIIHIYRLTVYALSEKTGLKEGFTHAQLLKAMEGKILGTGQLKLSFNN